MRYVSFGVAMCVAVALWYGIACYRSQALAEAGLVGPRCDTDQTVFSNPVAPVPAVNGRRIAPAGLPRCEGIFNTHYDCWINKPIPAMVSRLLWNQSNGCIRAYLKRSWEPYFEAFTDEDAIEVLACCYHGTAQAYLVKLYPAYEQDLSAYGARQSDFIYVSSEDKSVWRKPTRVYEEYRRDDFSEMEGMVQWVRFSDVPPGKYLVLLLDGEGQQVGVAAFGREEPR